MKKDEGSKVILIYSFIKVLKQNPDIDFFLSNNIDIVYNDGEGRTKEQKQLYLDHIYCIWTLHNV